MTSPPGLQDPRSWLERDDLTLEELVDAAASLLPEVAPRQTRYKVRERPDARTIRYYVTQGLLPRPAGYAGGRARYTGRHLLRLLAVKRMQAEHHTLSRIRAVLDGRSDEELLAELATALEAELGLSPPPPAEASEPSARGRRGRRSARELRRPATPARPRARARRLELSHGAAIEVPEGVLQDPERRRELARNLESLARWLEVADPDEDDPE